MKSLTKEEIEVTEEAIDSKMYHLKAVLPYLRPDPAKRDRKKVRFLLSAKKKLNS